MMGCNVASSEFDLINPRHSARKPPIELALPTSTANSVRCTAALGEAASDASGSFALTDAVTSGGDAAASSAFAITGFSISLSFWAAASGGAGMDFAATSGVAGADGVIVGAVEGAGAATAVGEAIGGFGSLAAASVRGFSDFGAGSAFGAGSVLATVAADGATAVVAGATVVAGAAIGASGATDGAGAAAA